MVTQLYREERIRTTKSKALEVRRQAEKLITRAKEDTVHNRRIVAKLIQDKAILAKLFTEIAPGFVDRPGGYTRILKLGYRKGDAAEMVLLELVGREEEIAPRRRRAKVQADDVSAEVQTEEAVETVEETEDAEESAEPVAAEEEAEDGTVPAAVEEEAAKEPEEEETEEKAEDSAESTEETEQEPAEIEEESKNA
jgi:large subunit ribosomal protein L17